MPIHFKGQQDTVVVPDKVSGSTYYVANQNAAASDDNPGTKDKPFKTLARPGAAGPGDLLHIAAGTYREALALREGTSDKPVIVEGESGTIVSGFDAPSGWQRNERGLYVIKDWKGGYASPMDLKEDDARAQPGNILFVDGQPMDFVATQAELVPGTWTVDPILGHDTPKTFTLCPLPGVDPSKVVTELSDCRVVPLLLTSKFDQVRGIHFTGGGVAVCGVANLLENCVVDWSGGNGIGISGRQRYSQ